MFLLERIEFQDPHLMVAWAVRIDPQETLPLRGDGAAIGIDMAEAFSSTNLHWIQRRQRFAGRFRRPAGDVLKPWSDQLEAFLDPAFVRDGARMGVGGRGTNILHR